MLVSRARAGLLLVAGLLGLIPVLGASAAATYTAPLYYFARPTASSPELFRWQGVKLNSPGSDSAVATPTSSCDVAGGRCEDAQVLVPSGLDHSTLYLKIQWQHPVWQAFMYAIGPDGSVYGHDATHQNIGVAGGYAGGGIGCDQNQLTKGCGNQTTLPLDELTIPNPQPGFWKIRVAAVNIHDEAYIGMAALTAQDQLSYARKQLSDLTSYLTRTQRVNVVFVGWSPSQQDLNGLVANLTTQFQPGVAEKQFGDCNDGNDLPASGLVQHETCHYTGTDPGNPNGPTPGATSPASYKYIPYFEPLKFNMDYHFLVADERYTQALFGAMRDNTTHGVAYGNSRIPSTTESAPFKTGYLTQYNASSGQFRAAYLQVKDTSVVDEIDGPAVEDWIFNNRLNSAFAQSFTEENPVDGNPMSTTGAQFINPDPTAAENPAWLNDPSNPNSGTNVDRDPQGLNQGISFFLVDTYSKDYANQFFAPNLYHSWWTKNHVIDPDTNSPAFADNGRGWGGKYRFHILDLGAAPTTYERSNWLSATINDNDGSAGFDPPVWQYENDPRWNGSQSPLPTQVAGNTLGQVMGFEITQGLTFKYLGTYLYRPIPNDVYEVATTQVVDHYSTPAGNGLYTVDMDKVDNPSVSLKRVALAAPYDTFIPGPSKTMTLGCAQYRVSPGSTPTGKLALVPDPQCTSGSDPFQQVIEDAKSGGSAGLAAVDGSAVPDGAVNQNLIRDYVDNNRPTFAPVVNGAFTVPVVNIMFEGKYNVAIPLVVGGIADAANNGEGWGQFDNVNTDLVPKAAIVCAKSQAVAPGCHGVPDVFRHDYYLTYTVIHESSHFLGLNHPHDGAISVAKDENGNWTYYYSMLKWLYDISASPTTYAGDYTTFEVTDQERLMYGHTAEYLQQAQDWIADAYFMDGALGKTGPSATTQARENAMNTYRDAASRLFQAGDYLHAQYAMKDAALYAKGVGGSQVAPHQVSLADAAADRNVLFKINPQQGYSPQRVATKKKS